MSAHFLFDPEKYINLYTVIRIHTINQQQKNRSSLCIRENQVQFVYVCCYFCDDEKKTAAIY